MRDSLIRMRLVTFHGPDGLHVGRATGDEVVDVTAARPDLPRDMAELLALGAAALDAVQAADNPRLPSADVRLSAPVPRPPKFLAIGLNYAAHVAESGMPKPDVQLWFNKQSSCVIGPGEPIHIPRASSMVDYEGELGFVIGRRCRHVPAARAAEVIAGYTVVNDVSVRDWQFRSPTMTMGKSFDTHGPLGPSVVTADEIADPHALRLQTWVNGELRQDAKTDDLIFERTDAIRPTSLDCNGPGLRDSRDIRDEGDAIAIRGEARPDAVADLREEPDLPLEVVCRRRRSAGHDGLGHASILHPAGNTRPTGRSHHRELAPLLRRFCACDRVPLPRTASVNRPLARLARRSSGSMKRPRRRRGARTNVASSTNMSKFYTCFGSRSLTRSRHYGGQAAPQSAACDSEGINERDLDRGMCMQECRQTKPFSE